MFNNLVIFLFLILIQIFKSQNYENISYTTINDKFSYMQYNQDKNAFNIYLGNELIFINFENSNKIEFNNESISFYDYDENNKKNLSIAFTINNTRIFYINDSDFIFLKGNNYTKFYLKNGENIKINNVKISRTANNFYLFSADNEYFFVEFFYFSFLLVFFGFFIILYGSYHFMLGLAVHLFFFLYFFVCDIITFFYVVSFRIYFFVLASFLIGISIAKLLNPKNEKQKRLKIVNAIYAATFWFIIFKTLIYYYIFFEFPICFVNENIRILLYILFLIIFIALGIVVDFFIKFNKHRFHRYHRYLYCSAVSGSFYIIKGMQYIQGGYFSSILFIKENLKFINIKNGELLFYSLTYFLVQLALIVFSIFFQFNYIKYKAIENPEKEIVIDSSLLPVRESNVSSSALDNSREEEVSLRGNKISENISSNENDDNEFNDQDD